MLPRPQARFTTCHHDMVQRGAEHTLAWIVNGLLFDSQFGTYLHELGHAVGLAHEHQLPTRDNFIKHLPANVDHIYQGQLTKYSPRFMNQRGTEYDLSSIMHYEPTVSDSAKRQTFRPSIDFVSSVGITVPQMQYWEVLFTIDMSTDVLTNNVYTKKYTFFSTHTSSQHFQVYRLLLEIKEGKKWSVEQ